VGVDLVGFTDEQKLSVIRGIREAVPVDLQDRWPLFCGAMAVPLLRQVDDDPLRPSDYLQTRRRMDRFFLTLGALVAIVSYGLSWYFTMLLTRERNPMGLAVASAPLLFLCGFWLWIRYTIPARGLIQRKPEGVPNGPELIAGILSCCFTFGGLALAVIPWIENFDVRTDLDIPTWLSPVGAAAGVAGIYGMYWTDQRDRARKLAVGRRAADEWAERASGSGHAISES
jgi:hypothetical protein